MEQKHPNDLQSCRNCWGFGEIVGLYNPQASKLDFKNLDCVAPKDSPKMTLLSTYQKKKTAQPGKHRGEPSVADNIPKRWNVAESWTLSMQLAQLIRVLWGQIF